MEKKSKIDGVPAARANGIGIIHQEIVLVPYLTVAQNLLFWEEKLELDLEPWMKRR